MKKLALIIAVLTFGSSVSAQFYNEERRERRNEGAERILRDETATPGRSGRVDYYNDAGERAATSRQAAGRTEYFSRTGRYVGHSVKRGDTTHYYDSRGAPAGTDVNREGRTEYYSRSGRSEGYAEKKKERTYHYDDVGNVLGYTKKRGTDGSSFYSETGPGNASAEGR